MAVTGPVINQVTDPGQPYVNMGARTAKRLLSTPGVIRELSPEQRSGMQFRGKTATWKKTERLVYAAVKEGYTSLDSLPIATGLTSLQVNKAISSLVSKGVITNIGVASEKS